MILVLSPVASRVAWTSDSRCFSVSLSGNFSSGCFRFLAGMTLTPSVTLAVLWARASHLHLGAFQLERSRLLVAEHEPSWHPGPASQTILGNFTRTISPIGSIVKSASTVQSSKADLTIYYVTISNEQHAEHLPRFKLLHFAVYLGKRILSPAQIQRSVCPIVCRHPIHGVNSCGSEFPHPRRQVGVSNSWDSSPAHLKQIQIKFDKLWEGREKDWIAVPVPEAVKLELLKYRTSKPPVRDVGEPKPEDETTNRSNRTSTPPRRSESSSSSFGMRPTS